MLKILGMHDEYPLENIAEEQRGREDYGDIEALARTIDEKGLIQPITINGDTGVLIAGGRRLAAYRHLERDTIPAILVEVTGDIDAIEIELIENRFRKNMHWWEEAKLEAQIHEYYTNSEASWSQQKTAKLLGISQGEVSKRLQLAQYLEVVPGIKEFENATGAVAAVERIVKDKLAERAANKHLAERTVASVPEQTEIPDGEGGEDSMEEASSGKTPSDESKDTTSTTKPSTSWGIYAELLPGAYQVGDALQGMANAQAGLFHMAEVDPPYGIELASARPQNKERITLEQYNEVPREEYEEFLLETAGHVYRLLAEDSFCVWWFGVEWYDTVKSVLGMAGFKVPVVPALWVKNKGQTNSPYQTLANHYETFFLARKGKPQLLKPGRSNVFTFDGVYGNARFHPTQKPVPLLSDILAATCPNNGMVLCPFLGSGATLLAAFASNRAGLGWDLDERNMHYFYSLVGKMNKGTDKLGVYKTDVQYGKPSKDQDGTIIPVLIDDVEVGIMYREADGPWQPDEGLAAITGEFTATSLTSARGLIREGAENS